MNESQEGRNEEAHDVLAAEEFAIPTEAPGIPHDRNPDAHDVLAAEEFAMPAAADFERGPARRGRLVALGGILAGIAALAWRRRRR